MRSLLAGLTLLVTVVTGTAGSDADKAGDDGLEVSFRTLTYGIIRVGGYGSTGLQDKTSGEFVRLVFKVKESGAKIELLKAEDDLKESILLK